MNEKLDDPCMLFPINNEEIIDNVQNDIANLDINPVGEQEVVEESVEETVEIEEPHIQESEEITNTNPVGELMHFPGTIAVEESQTERVPNVIKATFEETFMEQVSNLNNARIRRPVKRLIAETADIATDICYLASLFDSILKALHNIIYK